MNQVPTHASASFGSSRLIRFLSGLAVSNVEISHKYFVARIGQLVDFSDSIILAAAHRRLSSTPFEEKACSVEAVKEEFLRVRNDMVQSIIKSTTPNAPRGGIKLPQLRAGDPIEFISRYEPYQRFYVLHQRTIETKVHAFRIKVREDIRGVSARLAQLSALDTALGDTLLVNTRNFFAVLPRLLEKRFEYHRTQHQQAVATMENDDPALWVLPGGWLDKFYSEIQGLLLAELEVRLQPILGLIEALIKEVETTDD